MGNFAERSKRSATRAIGSWRKLLSSMTLAGLVSTNNAKAIDANLSESVKPGAKPGSQNKKNLSARIKERANLIRQLRVKGIKDEAVLDALMSIPRHEFVPIEYQAHSYDDAPLPIGLEQTISQPYIVAYMTEALKLSRSDKVLEIGTGSGYQAAVLSRLVNRVYSVELLEPLARRAGNTLREIGIGNVEIKVGDGYAGWPENGPFDAIIVTAAPESVPKALINQLSEGGRLMVPVGGREVQWLLKITKKNGKANREKLLPVRFVPLVPSAAR